ncbi:hypothetical protein DFP72DRAFT_1063832 [Ephemerocybe angulata]|uniref:Uncharacterized protein n=1 Tax=Ephemerocybe angulata TaxID=980116 RepID=A0A8H6I7T1_9AGAR|nr:hypothetical protein DFP72DRAFT_1063832 [Tulosesus angulatus]
MNQLEEYLDQLSKEFATQKKGVDDQFTSFESKLDFMMEAILAYTSETKLVLRNLDIENNWIIAPRSSHFGRKNTLPANLSNAVLHRHESSTERCDSEGYPPQSTKFSPPESTGSGRVPATGASGAVHSNRTGGTDTESGSTGIHEYHRSEYTVDTSGTYISTPEWRQEMVESPMISSSNTQDRDTKDFDPEENSWRQEIEYLPSGSLIHSNAVLIISSNRSPRIIPLPERASTPHPELSKVQLV